MATEFQDILDQYSPEERERLDADWRYVIKKKLPQYVKENPEKAADLLSTLTEEQLATLLKVGLGPRKRRKIAKLLAEQAEEEDAE